MGLDRFFSLAASLSCRFEMETRTSKTTRKTLSTQIRTTDSQKKRRDGNSSFISPMRVAEPQEPVLSPHTGQKRGKESQSRQPYPPPHHRPHPNADYGVQAPSLSPQKKVSSLAVPSMLRGTLKNPPHSPFLVSSIQSHCCYYYLKSPIILVTIPPRWRISSQTFLPDSS